jgi:acetyltransferase
VGNPIDFLATGTAEQLGYIIDTVENEYTDIDFSVVIFGSPGLFSNKEVYDLLDQKMKTCKKPIFPVLPSIINVKEEIEDFIAKGRINFPEECVLGNAICKVYNTPKPQPENVEMPKIDTARIRKCIDSCENGYIGPDQIYELLDAAGIAQKQIRVVDQKQQALDFANEVGYPLVMKVVGPVHKSDVGGVTLNVRDIETVGKEFDRLMAIKDTYAVEMYPMLDGTEVYIGAIRDAKFGHQVFFGLGGIFIEVLKDVQSSLVPISAAEAKEALTHLRGYKILQGVRGQQPVNVDVYAEQIARVAALVMAAPEIAEMDLNPLLGNPRYVTAVDARIRLEK